MKIGENRRYEIPDEYLAKTKKTSSEVTTAGRLEGRTMIIVAHRLSTLVATNRILVLRDGRIVEAGSFDDLLKRGGVFAELNAASAVPAEGILYPDSVPLSRAQSQKHTVRCNTEW